MPNTTIEKAICHECGVEARENTQFCYNCGTARIEAQSVVDGQEGEDGTGQGPTKEASVDSSSNGTVSPSGTALDELTARLKAEEPVDEKLAQAAEKRRKARVIRRQPKRYKWEPETDMLAARLLVFSVLIAFVAAVVVLITIFWK